MEEVICADMGSDTDDGAGGQRWKEVESGVGGEGQGKGASGGACANGLFPRCTCDFGWYAWWDKDWARRRTKEGEGMRIICKKGTPHVRSARYIV